VVAAAIWLLLYNVRKNPGIAIAPIGVPLAERDWRQ